jgi:hypothetical protein
VLVGFTGGSGGMTDAHAVNNVAISTQATVFDAGSGSGGGTDAASDAGGGADAAADSSSGGGADAASEAGGGADAAADSSSSSSSSSSGTDATSGSGTWQINGSATVTSTGFQLTDTGANEAGTVFYTQAVPSASLTATFDTSIGGGTGGADGLALILADPSSGATPTSVGVFGGGLGFSGIPGIAVAFDTFNNGANPSSNFIGISNGPLTGISNELKWLASTSSIPDLHAGSHHIVVTVTSGTLAVSIDGAAALSQSVTLPSNVLVGFSGGTGGYTDTHAVNNVHVTGIQ